MLEEAIHSVEAAVTSPEAAHVLGVGALAAATVIGGVIAFKYAYRRVFKEGWN